MVIATVNIAPMYHFDWMLRMLTREMQISGPIRTLLIEIDMPVMNSANETLCNFRISEGAACYAAAAYGSDPIQSFVLALDSLRNMLLERYPSATWNDLPIELAFPRHIPYFVGYPTYKEIEKKIDAHLEALERRFATDNTG